jgi:DNA anti-recombination protein RmuC
MDFTVIPRVAVGASLRALRLPVVVLGRVTGQERAERVELGFDNIDATARGAAGALLRDVKLREDARRRRAAMRERRRALRLREQAEHHAARADAQFDRRREDSERLRASAAQTAERRREQAEERREQAEGRAERIEEQRYAAITATAERELDATTEQARREHLDALQEEEAALRTREQALDARESAAALGRAAADAKRERKEHGFQSW